MTSGDVSRAALGYAARGIPVVPMHTPIGPPDSSVRCSCSRRSCPDVGKHPRTPRGLWDASTDPRQVAALWRRWPDANIGARTGIVFDVCDVDGPDAAAALRALLGPDGWPAGPAAATGHGWHLMVKPTGEGNRVGLLPGVDWRGAGGLVVLAPSLHATGRRYAWRHDLTVPLPELPAALRARLLPPAETAPATLPPPSARRATLWALAALNREVGAVVSAPRWSPGKSGRRNHTLNRAAFKLGQLVAAGLLEEADVRSALQYAATVSGLEEDRAVRTIASGLTAGRRHPRRTAQEAL
jgi:hypothetical protein